MQMMYPSLQRDNPSCGESEDGELMCKRCTHRCNRYKHYMIEMVGSAGQFLESIKSYELKLQA
jgi:hypothetical protein